MIGISSQATQNTYPGQRQFCASRFTFRKLIEQHQQPTHHPVVRRTFLPGAGLVEDGEDGGIDYEGGLTVVGCRCGGRLRSSGRARLPWLMAARQSSAPEELLHLACFLACFTTLVTPRTWPAQTHSILYECRQGSLDQKRGGRNEGRGNIT